jgi:hypothetical protein
MDFLMPLLLSKENSSCIAEFIAVFLADKMDGLRRLGENLNALSVPAHGGLFSIAIHWNSPDLHGQLLADISMHEFEIMRDFLSEMVARVPFVVRALAKCLINISDAWIECLLFNEWQDVRALMVELVMKSFPEFPDLAQPCDSEPSDGLKELATKLWNSFSLLVSVIKTRIKHQNKLKAQNQYALPSDSYFFLLSWAVGRGGASELVKQQLFIKNLAQIAKLEGSFSQSCYHGARFLFQAAGPQFFNKKGTCDCVLKWYAKYPFSGRFRAESVQVLGFLTKLIPPPLSSTLFASDFFKNSFNAALLYDFEDAETIQDYIIANADFMSIFKFVWKREVMYTNAPSSKCYFVLTKAMFEKFPVLVNKFFEAYCHEQLIQTLKRISQQTIEAASTQVLLETLERFLSLFEKHGKKKAVLVSYLLLVQEGIRAIFEKWISAQSRRELAVPVLRIASALLALCEQQVIAFFDTGFLGTVPKGAEEEAIGLLKNVCAVVRRTRGDRVAFEQLKVQWSSCGPRTEPEVVTEMCEVLATLEIEDKECKEVPEMIRMLKSGGPSPDAITQLEESLKSRGIDNADSHQGEKSNHD